MDYWDEPGNVDEYEQMAEGYDGRALVEYLATLIPAGARVLELGMGPGKDFALLRARGFAVVGSDASPVFVDRARRRWPDAEIVPLDAATLTIDRTFDAIYSNKVLQHLPSARMRDSLLRQQQLLPPGGVALHALWFGEEDQEHHGMLFVQYTEARLAAIMPEGLELVDTTRYDEMEPGDSLRVVLRRRAL